MLEHRPSEFCISSITLAELRFGAETRRSRKLHRLISTFVETVEVVSFDQSAAGRFATVAAALARSGEPIGTFDTLMAAHALSLGVASPHRRDLAAAGTRSPPNAIRPPPAGS